MCVWEKAEVYTTAAYVSHVILQSLDCSCSCLSLRKTIWVPCDDDDDDDDDNADDDNDDYDDDNHDSSSIMIMLMQGS